MLYASQGSWKPQTPHAGASRPQQQDPHAHVNTPRHCASWPPQERARQRQASTGRKRRSTLSSRLSSPPSATAPHTPAQPIPVHAGHCPFCNIISDFITSPRKMRFTKRCDRMHRRRLHGDRVQALCRSQTEAMGHRTTAGRCLHASHLSQPPIQKAHRQWAPFTEPLCRRGQRAT